jgi:hypothetical protein
MTENTRKGPSMETGDAYRAAVDTISTAVRTSLAAARRGGSSAVGAVTFVALGAIRGALEIGSDLTQAGRGIIVGVLHGSGDRGEAALGTISHAARTVLHHMATMGSDVTSVTTGLVKGAIQSALDFGVDVTRAASAAAQGAVEGAEDVSFAAGEQVRAALRGQFDGVRILLLPPYQEQER